MHGISADWPPLHRQSGLRCCSRPGCSGWTATASSVPAVRAEGHGIGCNHPVTRPDRPAPTLADRTSARSVTMSRRPGRAKWRRTDGDLARRTGVPGGMSVGTERWSQVGMGLLATKRGRTYGSGGRLFHCHVPRGRQRWTSGISIGGWGVPGDPTMPADDGRMSARVRWRRCHEASTDRPVGRSTGGRQPC